MNDTPNVPPSENSTAPRTARSPRTVAQQQQGAELIPPAPPSVLPSDETNDLAPPERTARGKRITKHNRKPFGSQVQKLAYPPRPGYHRHWFNDMPGRIEQALGAGYTHVEDTEGRKVQVVVGVRPEGGPLFGYLMEILQEWYDEDMLAGAQKSKEVEDAIRRGQVTGGLEQGKGGYVPKQGITVKDSRTFNK